MMNNMMFNFNSMGINNPIIGTNIQQNQMNGMMMDETAQNIRNIIKPYENKIRELEEIIKQKDFEIIVLKQRLNNNNSNINNLNPMLINMNMNPMMANMNMNPMMANMNMNPMNLMMGNMNQQMDDNDKEILLTIILENKKELIKCFINDKASILNEKCNLAKGVLTFNYKVVNTKLTIGENGIFNHSLIYVKYDVKSITFRNTQGISIPICLSDDCPLEIALIYYLMRLGRIMDRDNGRVSFLYNAFKLKFKDETPIKEIFWGNPIPTVIVKD